MSVGKNNISELQILSCKSIDGKKKYDLPAYLVGDRENYVIYARPDPIIIHHKKNKKFSLAHSELVLVGKNEYHVVSVAIDKSYNPVEMYININLIPEKNPIGYQWVDLELDIKLMLNHDRKFVPVLLDVDEYEENISDEEHKQVCEAEITKTMENIFSEMFPFCYQQAKQLIEKFFIEKKFKTK
ncbi:MAG: DUF402 domain-containing protein, partial [Myxococcales bacterium]|nr:DUF402 domain-containing protein [Myxococcales bacterium]